MNVSMRHEDVNGHSISGAVKLDIETGEFSADVLRVGGKVNSSWSLPPRRATRAEIAAKMNAEFDDEVAFALAH